MSDKKYYKNVFKLVVLSEEPIEDIDLSDINYEVTEGHWVLHTFVCDPKEVSPKQMVDLLNDAGSEPGFFQLNDDGTLNDE